MASGTAVEGDLTAHPRRSTGRTVRIKSSSPDVRAPTAPGRARHGCAVPSFRTGFVSRPAIVDRLVGATDASLALLVAPAGYGKSTLLAEWAARDKRPFVWVTLTPGEREVATVATAVCEAIVETGWVDSGAPARVSQDHRR